MPSEAIIEPDLPIVDAHHHMWDRRSFVDPAGSFYHGYEIVPERYMFEELLADAESGHNVIATVFVDCQVFYRADGPEAYKSVGETEFANGVAARSASGVYGKFRACAGIVSHVDLHANGSGAAAILEAHIAAGNGRFRGIRHSGAYDPDPGVMGQFNASPGLYRAAKFREGFATLAPLGLSFDAYVLEPQINDLIDLANAFPDTPIVLNHIGSPVGTGVYKGKRDERFVLWQASIRELARCDNVMLKLGGLAMAIPGFDCFMADPPQTSEQLAADWKPYIEICIEAFDADRCMFESNYPVDLPGATYPVLWNAFKRLAASCSADEKTALFSGSATRFYKLQI